LVFDQTRGFIYLRQVVQQEDFYPFGLAFNSYQRENSLENKYLYNGKELQKDLGLNLEDYGQRMFDPALGRWWVIDPLTEKMPSWSPYSYSFNNPIRFVDVGGMIPYPITIRSLAPFNSFGGGFHGDGNNRGFSTSYAQTARSSQIVFFDTDKGKPSTFNWSNRSSHPLLGEGRATPTGGVTSFSSSQSKDGSKKFDFETSLAAGNPLTPQKLTPDINVFSSMSITENKKAGTLSISGKLTGDNFPSTEAFISDPSGNHVFLAAGFYEGNPYSSLPGENKDNPVAEFNLTLSVDKDGNFTGINHNGKNYSLNDWNKMFQQADPKIK